MLLKNATGIGMPNDAQSMESQYWLLIANGNAIESMKEGKKRKSIWSIHPVNECRTNLAYSCQWITLCSDAISHMQCALVNDLLSIYKWKIGVLGLCDASCVQLRLGTMRGSFWCVCIDGFCQFVWTNNECTKANHRKFPFLCGNNANIYTVQTSFERRFSLQSEFIETCWSFHQRDFSYFRSL